MEGRNIRGEFNEDFKQKIVTEIENGKRSSKDISLAYGIKGHSTILKWCRQYGGNQYTIMSGPRKSGLPKLKDDQVLLLQNQVKVLERELREARFKQATLETVIDIAESRYSINIKKKCGGKQ
jgi:transposase-like protein